MKDKLHQLRELLTPPQNWTKGAFGRNKEGVSTGTALHPDATCFCLLGGIDRVAPEGPHARNPLRYAIHTAIKQRYQHQDRDFLVQDFNDDPDTTHQMVLNVIDQAVANA